MKTLMTFAIFFILYLFPLLFSPVLPEGHLLFAFTVFTLCLIGINLGNLLSFWANLRYASGNTTDRGLYRLAILRDTNNPVTYLNYGVILMTAGDFAGALPHLKNARMLNTRLVTDQHILSSTAHCYHGLGEHHQALATLLDYHDKYGTLTDPDQQLLAALRGQTLSPTPTLNRT